MSPLRSNYLGLTAPRGRVKVHHSNCYVITSTGYEDSEIVYPELTQRTGCLERYHVARNALRYYTNVGCTARYSFPSELLKRHNGLEALVHTVLLVLIQKHAVLGITIDDEQSKDPKWIRLSSINLQEVVHFESGEVESIVEAATQRPFEGLGRLPCWFIVVSPEIPSSTESKDDGKEIFNIGFFFHHAIADGGSGAAFHSDFLDAANDCVKAPQPPVVISIVAPPIRNLLPELEATPLPLTMWFTATKILGSLGLFGPDPHFWTGPPIARLGEQPVMRVSSLHLDPVRSQKLVQLSRTNSTTITPLLTYIIVRLLADLKPKHSRFSCTIPYSMRRHTGADARDIVNHISAVDIHYSTVSRRGFISCEDRGDIDWAAVQEVKSLIDSAAKSPTNQPIAMFKYIKDYAAWMQNRAGTARSGSFELSNIGALDGGLCRDRAITFDRLVFSQSNSVTGDPYWYNVCAVKDGWMSITVSWLGDVMAESETAQMMTSLKNRLVELTQ